jgi:MYXO-CTERM domain-containing protein
MKKLLAVLTFLLMPSFSHAILINGGFETGNFTGWQTIGDALVVDASFGTPPAGSYQALVTNAPGNVGELLHPGTFSGTPSVFSLDSFMGLPTFSIALFGAVLFPGGLVTEGSAIKQSFDASAGDVVSFRWNYITNDGPCCDFAFIVLDGTLSFLASAKGSQLFNSSLPFFHTETGYNLFATSIPTDGTHTIGIGVVDVTDQSVNSAVLLDNFLVTIVVEPPGSSAVPEPPAWLLMGLGLLVLRRFYERPKSRALW